MKIFAACLLFFWSTFAIEPNTVIATIDVGENPSGIAVTPNNLYAYVANNNTNGIPGGDTVSVLYLQNNTLLQTISDSSFNGPYTVTINAAGTIAYVANSNGSTVTMIDINTNTVIGTIGGFDGPSGFAITPDGLHAYVNNYGGPIAGSGNGTTVSYVDLQTNTIVGTITLGMAPQAPQALAITPDGQYVYVANYVDGNTGTGTVSVIHTTNNMVIDTITGFSGPFNIAITPNGQYAYVTNFGSNNFSPYGTTVTVIKISNNTIHATVTCGTQPAGVAITPDGAYTYVTNYNTQYLEPDYMDLTPGPGTVNIIDTQTNAVISPTIAVGASPGEIAISPSGYYAYVTNYNANTVSVIALPPFQIIPQGCKTVNKFLFLSDPVNKITWTTVGAANPEYYSIYRDAGLTDLAGTVNAPEPHVFYDHNTNPNATYTYYITGTYANGTTLDPVAVTVSQGCGQ